MSAGPANASDLLFRLLGYGGLGGVALANLQAAGSAEARVGLWLLLLLCLVWPPGWWCLVCRYPALRTPNTAAGQTAHALECLLIMCLAGLAGFELWLAIVIGVLCLTGVTALGGLPLLGPCALAIGLALLLLSRGLIRSEQISPALIASGMLLASFLLGLAFVSFKRVRRLDDHRRLALSESALLRHRNERLARYLPHELTPLVSARPEGVNRPADQFATVAFVDVVGFVELVASRPMAELVDVLNDFMSTVSRLTERRGGTLGKFLGDGVLVYFPEKSPGSADDRWHQAVSCARLCLDLGPGLTTLSAAWQRRGIEIDLNIRAGISSGYCAIGDWGGDQRLDYTVIGTPVNLASRLQALAEAGTVLLSSVSASLVSEDGRLAACLGPAVEAQIKGFGPCMVHELCASAKVRAHRKP